MTTPIPNKLTILEKGFEFVPKTQIQDFTGYGVVTSDKGPSMSKRDNGDSAIPTTLASRQLFYYLCPLRALRITCDEYLLLFYMSAPTFGYTVRLNFTPKFYDYKRAVTFAKHIKAEDIQKAREACFRALRELGEKGTYLAQFTVAELTMADARDVLVTDCLPKLNRLEVFQLYSWSYSDPKRLGRQFVLDNPKVAEAFPTMLMGSRRTLVSLSIYLSTDLDELRVILSQTSSSLKKFTLNGQRIYSRGGTPDCLVNSKTIAVIVETAPNITSLTLNECNIDTGFFRHFDKFKKGLQVFHLGGFDFTSEDRLELRWLAEACHDTLEEVSWSSAYRDSWSTTTSQQAENDFPLFLGFVGRLKKSNDKIEKSNSDHDLFCFPRLRIFNSTHGTLISGDECFNSFNSLSFPALVKLSVHSYTEGFPSCSVSVLETISEHRGLTSLRLPRMEVLCSDASELNHALNKLGENLTLLTDLNLPLSFPSLSDEDFKEKITFEGWRNLKKITELRDVQINDNLLAVIGESWGNNRFNLLQLGSNRVKSHAKFISDRGLLALAKVTSSVSHPSFASGLLRSITLENAENITDEGFAAFACALIENADKNPALQGEDRKMYRGLTSVGLSKSRDIGKQTIKTLAKYHPNLDDLDITGTYVGQDAFEEIAKMKKLECFMIRTHLVREVSMFQILADNLLELGYLDVHGCSHVCGTAKHRELRKIFQKQRARNELFIAIDHSDLRDEDD
jgi:hypothetical protein